MNPSKRNSGNLLHLCINAEPFMKNYCIPLERILLYPWERNNNKTFQQEYSYYFRQQFLQNQLLCWFIAAYS